MRHRPLFSFLSVIIPLFAAVSTAAAHHLPPGMEEVDEFANHASFLIGFNHPLTGLDHMVVALLTGWLAARLDGWRRAALIPAAVLGLFGGAFIASLGLILPASSAVLTASVILSALAVSFQSVSQRQIGAGILILLQLWQGNSYQIGLTPHLLAGPSVAGLCAATALTMVLGFTLALLAKRHLPGVLTGAQPA